MNTQHGPTMEQITALHGAFQWFNDRLFGGTLPPVMLTFSRRQQSHGFFSPDRWVPAYLRREDTGQIDATEATLGDRAGLHEIALNPDTANRPARDVFSTLVHEMAHLWQQTHGKPPRRCYHDRQWAEKMREVGLIPSATGAPGGKTTGQSMSHFVDPEGRFQTAFDHMPASLRLPFIPRPMRAEEKPKKPASKVKYTCPACNANAWGKPGLVLYCAADCDEHLAAGIWTKERMTEEERDEP